jgi:hypothetical protein
VRDFDLATVVLSYDPAGRPHLRRHRAAPKLEDSRQIVGGAAIFVVLASIVSALVTPALARKLPKMFKQSRERPFFDANLLFAEKIARWRVQPTTSPQLLTTVLMMSLLAVAVVSVRSAQHFSSGKIGSRRDCVRRKHASRLNCKEN